MAVPTWEVRPGDAPRLVHVSAAARGGGVAALLDDLVAAQDADGTSVGWAVIGGDETFFDFTRYVHHLLHGGADTRTAGRIAGAMPHYRASLAAQADWLAAQLEPGDVVVLHDPQTLGMAPVLAGAGLKVVWHCHVGTTADDASGPSVVWDTFSAELSCVDTVVTTLPELAPQVVPAARRYVVAAAVDPHSARNRPLAKDDVAELLAEVGLPADAPVVAQVVRWEPLDDIPGVLRCVPGFPEDVHLVLAGYEPRDPGGRAVFEEAIEHLGRLAEPERARVHVVTLTEERGALTVNALQRRAEVVLQKNLAEGLGLTLTDAMVKGCAVVAADVGALRQQVSPGHNGLLVNPRDTESVVDAVRTLLDDPLLRRRLGKRAVESMNRRYLMARLVADYRLFAAPERRGHALDAA